MARWINADHAVNGMELAAPIKNKFGQIIIPAGIKLEEKHKNVLKTWGIDKLFVLEENELIMEAKFDETKIEEAKILLSARMKWSAKNNHEKELQTVALNHILKKYF